MEEESAPSATSKLSQTGTSHLDDLLKAMIASELANRPTSERDFDKLDDDQRARVLLKIAMTSEASEQIRLHSLDRLSVLLTGGIRAWNNEKLVPFTDELIKCLLTDVTDSIRGKMGDILVKVADHSLYLHNGTQTDPSITNFIQNCIEKESISLKKVALAVVRGVPNVFGSARFNDVKVVLQRALNDADPTVRFAAMQIFCAVINKDTIADLAPFLPSIIQNCKGQLPSDEEFHSTSFHPIECIWEIARLDPKLLVSEFFAIIALSTKIICKTNTVGSHHMTARAKAFDILSKLFGATTCPNTDSETGTMALTFQQLTKLAYCENAKPTMEEIIELLKMILFHFEDDEMAESWSVVHEEMKKLPQSDRNLMITFHFIRAIDVFRSCPSAAHPFFSICFSHALESIRSLALKAYEIHCSRLMKNEANEDFGNEDLLRQLDHLFFPRVLMFAKEGSAVERGIARDYLYSLSNDFNVVLLSRTVEIVNFYCQMLLQETVSRSQASNCIIQLCEMSIMAGNIVPLIPLIISSCLRLLSRLAENLVNWETRDQFLEDVDNDGLIYGDLNCLSRIISALKRRGGSEELLRLTSQMLDHDDWKQRYVGVLGLSAIYYRQLSSDETSDVLKRVTSLLHDTDDRVRSAACTAMIRFFPYNDDPDENSRVSRTMVIPALLTLVGDPRVPRLAAAAAAALTACCKVYPESVIRAHLSALMHAAVRVVESTYRSLLANGKTRILAQPIKLISSMQEVASSYYGVYYSDLRGPLKTIITSLTPIHQFCPILYSASLECMSLIAIVIGEKKCSSDCAEIMRFASTRFDSILPFPESSMILGRIATAMGNSFRPFLPSLMPLILDSIAFSSLVYNDHDELVENENDEGRARKAAACSIAIQLAKAVGDGFLPYASEITLLALAHFTMSIYDHDVAWSVLMIPQLLQCFKDGQDEMSMEKLWNEYWLQIRDKLKEGDGKPFVQSITECIQIIGRVSKEESVVINEWAKNEKESIRLRREQMKMEREEAMKMANEEFENVEALTSAPEKEDKALAKSIQTLEYHLMRFTW